MDKYGFLKTDFDALRAFLAQELGADIQPEFTKYVLAGALRIWGANRQYCEDYAGALTAISGEVYSKEQIVTAMDCCYDVRRTLAMPNFLDRLGQKADGDTLCSACIEDLNQLFVCLSSINGDFTIEEANTLSLIIRGLTDACTAKGLSLKLENMDTSSLITGRNEASYWCKPSPTEAPKPTSVETPKPTSAEPQNLSPKEDKPDEQKELEPIQITLRLSLDNDNNIGSSSSSADTEEPKKSSPQAEKSLEELLAELDGLVGLDTVKRDVHSLMNYIKVANIRKERNMKVPTISYHLVFTGNPGTGKTTVARLVAQLYYHMGILPKGQLVETDRSALVAGYLGQTAIKTQKVIQEALGGVLFIDEAYSLARESEDMYGKEAIETILKAMEDHRGELVVIVAGYDELMHKFIDSNPGLASRFSKYFHFPDYTGEELLKIFERFCSINGYRTEACVSESLLAQFMEMYDHREEHFGNARSVRNLFEKALSCQADRIANLPQLSDEILELLTQGDLEAAMEVK